MRTGCESGGSARVLDFGCGTGLLTERLAADFGHVIAVDSSAAMIEVVRQKCAKNGLDNVLPLHVSIDAEALALHGNALRDFDLVVASSVCSFLPDFGQTLRDIVSVMSRRGVFAQWDWASSLSAEQIAAAYEYAGLRVHVIENAFEMTGEEGSAAVLVGIGRVDSAVSG